MYRDKKRQIIDSQEVQIYSLEKKLDSFRVYEGTDQVVSSEQIREIIKDRPVVYPFTSGLPTLDKALGGFIPGQLVVVSGPTGNGKTMFCQSLTRHFAEEGVAPLWFSYEVTDEELIARFERGGKLPVFYAPLEYTSSDLDWMRDRTYEGIAKYGARAVFIDHMHYLLDMKGLSKTRERQDVVIGFVMRELKKLAVFTNTVVFLVAHITKIDDGKDPTINDLRDSSFISQEADAVLMVWRKKEDDYREASGFRYLDETVCSIQKNRRRGELKSFLMTAKDGDFVELSKTYEPNQ